jgi:hypothetical protein
MLVRLISKERDKFVYSLMRPINTASTIIISAYTILWGCWIVNPFWNIFDHSPLYSWMQSVAPEGYWGGQAILVGVAITYGVLRNSYRSLTCGAFIGFLHWLLISVGYFIADWQNTGGVTSLMISVYCAFVYLNIRINRHNLPFKNETDTI